MDLHKFSSLQETSGAPLMAASAERGVGRGALHVRLVRTPGELQLAQRLRYDVFFEEQGRRNVAGEQDALLDRDEFDTLCDHLLVLDGMGEAVATCRMLRADRAVGQGYYTAREFDISAMIAAEAESNIMELGRTCVRGRHRGGQAIILLWRGLMSYICDNGIDLMFGCASLAGGNLCAGARQLSRLRALAPVVPEWRISALQPVGPALGADEPNLDRRELWASLPPLLKAYLRLGASVGQEAAYDPQFGTVDVFVAMRTAEIRQRYVAYFGADAASAAMPSR